VPLSGKTRISLIIFTCNRGRQLGSYLGLTPSDYDSGSTTRCQGISKAGNSWARTRPRREVAWLGNTSPAVRWYARKTADQSPRIQRLYREERLTVRRRGGRKRGDGDAAADRTRLAPDQRWNVRELHRLLGKKTFEGEIPPA
jgi:hypothetical protein